MVSGLLSLPVLRDTEFWKEPIQREQFKSRGEKLTRPMRDSNNLTRFSSSRMNEQSMDLNSKANSSGSASTDSGSVEVLEPKRKRKRFSLKNQLMVAQCPGIQTDEVSRYKYTELAQFGLNRDSFLSEPFSRGSILVL